MPKKSVPGYARLRKNEQRSVPTYAWLHESVTEASSRLRTVKQKRNQGRFPVMLGYTKA